MTVPPANTTTITDIPHTSTLAASVLTITTTRPIIRPEAQRIPLKIHLDAPALCPPFLPWLWLSLVFFLSQSAMKTDTICERNNIMKKIVILTISILFLFCSCDLPNISIQIDYGDKETTGESVVPPESQETVTEPIETQCVHSYRVFDNRTDGRCVKCGYCDAYYASFYDVSELVIKNGTALPNEKYQIKYMCSNSSFSIRLIYDKPKKEFTLVTTDSSSSMNMYITIDALRNCSFIAGYEISGEAVCAAAGRIDTPTYSLSGFVSISKYDGPADMRDVFIKACEAFVDGTLAEFSVYIQSNTAYTISDLGFKNLNV